MIDRLRELLLAATPLPLKVRRYVTGGGRVSDGSDRTLIADFYNEADREAWIALREGVPELLDAHDRMAGALAAAKEMERALILFVAQAHRTPDLAREGIAALREFQARAALAVPKEENPDA